MINFLSLVFLIPAIICGAIGSLFLKQGSKKFTLNPFKALKNHKLIIGVFFYGMSMILYIQALRFGNLSIVYPLSSFTYILVSILSVKFLNENMNKNKWLGIIFIIIGAFLIAG